MKQPLPTALFLVVAAGAIVGLQASSRERLEQPADDELARVVDNMQDEVQSLRADVDYLLVSEKYNQEEIGYLQELVRVREATHERVLAGVKAGVTTHDAEVQVRYHLSLARAQLDWARGDMSGCQKAYGAAIRAAEVRLTRIQRRLQQPLRQPRLAGRMGMDSDAESLMEAVAQLTDAKLNLSRVKNKVAWKKKRP